MKICPRHTQVLREFCPATECGRSQPFLAASARAGYCSYCSSWLGGEYGFDQADEIQLELAPLEWHGWVATSIGELISAAPSFPSGFSVSGKRGLAGLMACLASVGGNSYLRLSEILKVSPKALQTWARRGSLPNIDNLLRLSFSLGVSLKALLMGDESLENTQKLMTVPVSAMPAKSTLSRRIKPRIVKIRTRLERFVWGAEFPPPSVNQVAMRLGCDDSVLRHHFPEQCSSIAIRYRDYVQATKQRRRKQICQQIKTIVSCLSEEGIYPSAKRVQGLLKSTTDFRDPELRETWRKAKKEVDIAAQKKS